MLINGKAIMNPASWGFLKDNQLAKEIIRLEKKILRQKTNIKKIIQRNF